MRFLKTKKFDAIYIFSAAISVRQRGGSEGGEGAEVREEGKVEPQRMPLTSSHFYVLKKFKILVYYSILRLLYTLSVKTFITLKPTYICTKI